MKKQTLKLALLATALVSGMSNKSFAQTWVASSGNLITSSTTNVGVKDNSPTFPLSVNGDIGFTYSSGRGHANIKGNCYTSGLCLFANNNFGNGAAILMDGDGTGSNTGIIDFLSIPQTTSNVYEPAFRFMTASGPTSWNNPMVYITKLGNVGIGTTSPDEKLSIDGNINFKQSTSGFCDINGSSNSGGPLSSGLSLSASGSNTSGAGIIVTSNTATDQGEVEVLATEPQTSNEYEPAFRVRTVGSSWNDPFFTVFKNGKVAIGENVGISTTYPYRLYVKDGIITERLKVAIHGTINWADYVFAPGYALKSLTEVENFIQDNKHLPGIPSAAEVVKDGIDVATMDAKLLQKIEELTLYVIQQQKEINELKIKMNK